MSKSWKFDKMLVSAIKFSRHVKEVVYTEKVGDKEIFVVIDSNKEGVKIYSALLKNKGKLSVASYLQPSIEDAVRTAKEAKGLTVGVPGRDVEKLRRKLKGVQEILKNSVGAEDRIGVLLQGILIHCELIEQELKRGESNATAESDSLQSGEHPRGL